MRLIKVSMLGLAVVLGGAAMVHAQGGPMEQRQQIMKANGAAMRAMRDQIGNAATLPQVAASATEISAKTKTLPGLFPAGSQGGRALPAIWEKPADFQAAVNKASDLAAALASAAQSGNVQATQAAYAALGQQGCGGCHQGFQKPNN